MVHFSTFTLPLITAIALTALSYGELTENLLNTGQILLVVQFYFLENIEMV
jgi:hypothetical protein